MKMKPIDRAIDDLGRICIPKEYRRQLDIEEGDTLEITLSEEQITIKKKEEQQ